MKFSKSSFNMNVSKTVPAFDVIRDMFIDSRTCFFLISNSEFDDAVIASDIISKGFGSGTSRHLWIYDFVKHSTVLWNRLIWSTGDINFRFFEFTLIIKIAVIVIVITTTSLIRVLFRKCQSIILILLSLTYLVLIVILILFLRLIRLTIILPLSNTWPLCTIISLIILIVVIILTRIVILLILIIVIVISLVIIVLVFHI